MNNKSVAVFLVLFISSFVAYTQEIETSLISPYNTIYTHLYFLQTDSYEPQKSSETIYGEFSLEKKQEIAIKIKKVLDGKGLYILMDQLPRNNNYLDSLSKRNIYYLSEKEKLIYLEKIGNNWYYSKTTIENIDKLYKGVFPFWAIYIDKLISYKFSNKKFLGIGLNQYIALVLLFIFSFFFYLIIKKISHFIISRLTSSSRFSGMPKDILYKIAKSFGLVLTLLLLSKAIPSVQLPLKLSIGLVLASKILLIFFMAYFTKNLFTFLLFYLEKIVEKTDTKLDNQFLPILKKIGKLIIYFVAIIYVLKELNINITALLAGLSIGGLAIALASKDTVQNVIGSLNIFLDRPFEIGDYIKIEGAEGIVEEVGLRATRIRTLNQSLAYVPNGNLSNMTIDNFGLRIYRRWKTSFGLDYNTKSENIELFIEETIKILDNNEHTLNDKTMVYFTNLGESTLDIYLSVFFDVKTFSEDMQCKQNILLAILKMASKNNIEFAFPTRTIYNVK